MTDTIDDIGRSIWTMCEGEQDNDGRAACDGPDVQTYRAKAPGSDEWFTTRWCAECAAIARMDGYKVHRITVPT